MPLLEGKKVLIAGIANHRSIGWAIAQAFAREGAQLAFTYQERMEKYVKELAEKIPNTPTILCDVQSDEQIDSAFEKAGNSSAANLTPLSTQSPSLPHRNWRTHSTRPRAPVFKLPWTSAPIHWWRWHAEPCRSCRPTAAATY